MSVKMSMSGPEQHRHADQLDRPFQQDVLDQVERIVGSTHFRNSKRYPALLRFIVEEALAGRGESLKERTLGIEVFGRSPDYDTNADPVVRVSAGEIRKRLAQYYQAPQHEGELQVDLPLGSYAPHFFSAASRPGARFAPRRSELLPNEGLPSPIDASISVTPTIAESSAQTPVEPPAIDAPGTPFHAKQPGRHRRLLVWLSIACGLFLTALLVGGLRRHGAGEGAVTAFWRPLLESKDAALIVIGVHTFDETGKDISPSSDASTPLSNRQSMLYSMTRSDMVSVTDLYAYSAVVNPARGALPPLPYPGLLRDNARTAPPGSGRSRWRLQQHLDHAPHLQAPLPLRRQEHLASRHRGCRAPRKCMDLRQ